MAELRLSAQPGFVELADAGLETGVDLAGAAVRQIAANAAFGAVRTERFQGYYRNGETVQLPVSPADGYEYSRAECCYAWSVYWSGSAMGPLNGTQEAPERGATGSPGHLWKMGGYVDQATGEVSCDNAYERERGGAQANHDGILLVITFGKRLR